MYKTVSLIQQVAKIQHFYEQCSRLKNLQEQLIASDLLSISIEHSHKSFWEHVVPIPTLHIILKVEIENEPIHLSCKDMG
jgi:hypothetical protein